MFSPGPRLFGAGGLQELQMASVSEGHSALDFEKPKAVRAYRHIIYAGLALRKKHACV